MNPIYNNPYRILGLSITASEREITKQINTLATYAEMGKTKSFDNDFPFLCPIERTPETIEEAKKQIEQSENKFLYSLFWFWKNNSVDELAYEVLKEGNIDKAITIWEKSVFANKNKVYKPFLLNENLIASSPHFDNVDDEDHLFEKNGNEYLIERKKEDNYSIPTAFYDLSFEENWIIECDVTWKDGVDSFSYGIVFGRGKGSYYFFGIAGTGSYIYGRYNDWIYTPLIEWTKNNDFNNWSTNKLRIEKVDNTLKFYINDEFVNSAQAEPFFGKHFGFKVTKKQKVSFRNFRFSRLVEDDTYGEGLNVSSKNFSNVKNLSNLYLSLSLGSSNDNLKAANFKKGIALAKSIFSNGNLVEYSKLVAGEKHNYSSEKTIRFYINNIVDSIKPLLDLPEGIKTSELIQSFSRFPVEAKQILNSRFIIKQIQNIDDEIESATESRRGSPSTALAAGKLLIKNTKTDIDYLKDVLGEEDYQYQTIADKLALAIIQCGVDSFNACKDSAGEIDYGKAIRSEESYLKEYEYALTLGATERVKERATENLATCRQYIENKSLYTCFFCENNPPEAGSEFQITIYKETSRSSFPRRTVQFSYIPVTIPRCSSCERVHSQSSDNSNLALILSAVAGVIIGAIADGYWFAGLLIGGIVGWVIGQALKTNKISKAKIKGTNQSTISKYPVLRKKIVEGWQFNKPSA